MVPTSASRVASNVCFGSGSDGRPAESDGACSCSVHKKIMSLSQCECVSIMNKRYSSIILSRPPSFGYTRNLFKSTGKQASLWDEPRQFQHSSE